MVKGQPRLGVAFVALMLLGAPGMLECNSARDVTSDADAGAPLNGSSADASPLQNDANADGGDGHVPLVLPAHPPDFPAHFYLLTPPTVVDVLTDLCAIDTSAPTVTLCPSGASPVTYAPSNLVVVDAQNATVLWVASLHLARALKVTGSRALAIVSAGELRVQGAIDVSARGAAGGPGALDGGVGAGTSGACNQGVGASAGGGAGFGGDGGNVDSPGGMFYGQDAAVFVGGSPGGSSCARGGRGGGALQLSSAGSLFVLPGASLRASGGGGEAWPSGGGAGGGSGGAIFLESLNAFIVSADVTANGGGGGSSGGSNGEDGQPSETPAQGGFASDGGANGGSGGALATAAAPGVNGGGGGGSVGRIWYRTMKVPTGTPTFSPPPTVLSF
jgi:hypothetical protein